MTPEFESGRTNLCIAPVDDGVYYGRSMKVLTPFVAGVPILDQSWLKMCISAGKVAIPGEGMIAHSTRNYCLQEYLQNSLYSKHIESKAGLLEGMVVCIADAELRNSTYFPILLAEMGAKVESYPDSIKDIRLRNMEAKSIVFIFKRGDVHRRRLELPKDWVDERGNQGQDFAPVLAFDMRFISRFISSGGNLPLDQCEQYASGDTRAATLYSLFKDGSKSLCSDLFFISSVC